jgi:hypothetical protein
MINVNAISALNHFHVTLKGVSNGNIHGLKTGMQVEVTMQSCRPRGIFGDPGTLRTAMAAGLRQESEDPGRDPIQEAVPDDMAEKDPAR